MELFSAYKMSMGVYNRIGLEIEWVKNDENRIKRVLSSC
jgi:hypothetical protein